MKRKLTKRLSPKAKRLYLQATPGEQVACLIQISPTADTEALRHDLETHGAVIRSWMDFEHLVTVEVDATQLTEVAELDGVIYLEAGERYQS